MGVSRLSQNKENEIILCPTNDVDNDAELEHACMHIIPSENSPNCGPYDPQGGLRGPGTRENMQIQKMLQESDGTFDIPQVNLLEWTPGPLEGALQGSEGAENALVLVKNDGMGVLDTLTGGSADMCVPYQTWQDFLRNSDPWNESPMQTWRGWLVAYRIPPFGWGVVGYPPGNSLSP